MDFLSVLEMDKIIQKLPVHLGEHNRKIQSFENNSFCLDFVIVL